MRTFYRIFPPALALAILIPGIVGGVLFAKVLPDVRHEYEARIGSLPRFLALSNRTALLRRDLPTLQGNVDALLGNASGDDLLYIYFLDAHGEVLATAFEKNITPEARTAVENHLKGLDRNQEEEARRAVKEGRTDIENLTGAPAKSDTSVVTGSSGFPPITQARPPEAFEVAGLRVVDVAIPMATTTRAFGGIRVGFRDTLSARERKLKIGFGVFAIVTFLLLVGGGFFLAGRIETETEESTRTGIASERRRMEEDFAKRLRAVEAKQEEDSPLTATEFFALLDTAKRLGQSLDYNEILSLGVQSTLQALDVRDMSLFLLDPERNELFGRAGHDETGDIHGEEMSRIRIPVGQGDIGLAAEFGTTAVIDNPKPGSAIVSALVARGKVLGVILARNKVSGRPMLKKDALVLRQLSALIAGALENAALYHQAVLTHQEGGGHTGMTPQ